MIGVNPLAHAFAMEVLVKEVVTYLLRSDVIQWKLLEWTS